MTKPTKADVEKAERMAKQVHSRLGSQLSAIRLVFQVINLPALIAAERERDELQKNCAYWVEQHGIEAEKRGECELELSEARGNLKESFELLERKRDQLRAELAAARVELEREKEQNKCCPFCNKNACVDSGDGRTNECLVCKLRTHNTLLLAVAEVANYFMKPSISSQEWVTQNALLSNALTSARDGGALDGGKQ